jgi:hypothetical protein
MAEFQTPIRRHRVLECPPAPRHSKRRPSFFEDFPVKPRIIDFDLELDLDEKKINMVKNFLKFFPSGSFRHNEELSKKVVEALKCECKRIDEEYCIYSN